MGCFLCFIGLHKWRLIDESCNVRFYRCLRGCLACKAERV